MLARLTSSKKYQDSSELGDRVLSIMVGKGFYQFGTYDIKGNNANVVNQVPYGDNLEGNWNYLYFSYTQK